MDLDAVKPRGLGLLGGVAEARDDPRELVIPQLARDLVGPLAQRRVGLVVFDPPGAGADRLGALVEERVAGPAAMPQLPRAWTAAVTFFQAATWAAE